MSVDYAWAAGFFDGEGCIQLTTRKRGPYESWQIMVTAVNTDIRPLHKLKCLFGGSVLVLHKGGNDLGYMPSWQWCTSHRKAEAALRAMLPYLIVKAEQAGLALLSREYVKPKYERLTLGDRNVLVDIRSRLQWMKKNPPPPAEHAGQSILSVANMES